MLEQAAEDGMWVGGRWLRHLGKIWSREGMLLAQKLLHCSVFFFQKGKPCVFRCAFSDLVSLTLVKEAEPTKGSTLWGEEFEEGRKTWRAQVYC